MKEDRDIQLYWERTFQDSLDESLRKRVLERVEKDAAFKDQWLMERDDWIDKYLRAQLSDEEFKHFLALLRKDDDFYKVVCAHRKIFLALNSEK